MPVVGWLEGRGGADDVRVFLARSAQTLVPTGKKKKQLLPQEELTALISIRVLF